MNTTVKIKRLDKTLPLPSYQTEYSSGMDVYSSIDCKVKAGNFRVVPTGISLEIPEGMEGQVRARSGMAAKYGIGVLNGPGTVDSDYRGEIKVILFNFSNDDYNINKGDRIAQIVFSRVTRIDLEEKDKLKETTRNKGGFGSTGK